MFDSLPTLHNCFIFPNITMNISTSTIGFARKLHYLDPEHNATADNVAQTLENCLSGYYETLTNQKFEKSPDYSTLYSYESGSYPRRGYGNDLIDGICARIPTSINPDVGGVGVSDSDRFSHRCSRG